MAGTGYFVRTAAASFCDFPGPEKTRKNQFNQSIKRMIQQFGDPSINKSINLVDVSLLKCMSTKDA